MQEQNQRTQISEDYQGWELHDLEQDKLFIISSYPNKNYLYQISNLNTFIGKHKTNQICIKQPTIDNFHLEIKMRKDRHIFRDLGSKNGTYMLVQNRIAINRGSIIQLGDKYLIQINYNKNQVKMIVYFKNLMQEQGVYSFNRKQFNTISIGRKAINNISFIKDLEISNVHCQLYFIHNILYLEDNSSTNGSWIKIGGQKKRSKFMKVQNNMVLKIGRKFNSNLEKSIIRKCIKCNKNENDLLFIPCKHNYYCHECGCQIKICPCKQFITQSIKFYRS